MKVLIDQQFHLGHHYQYLSHLLPKLVGLGDEIVVAVTPEGRESTQFETFLTPWSQKVVFQSILPFASPGMPLGERWKVHCDLRDAVRQVRPDYVLIPSGDGQTTAMSLFRLAGAGNIPGRLPCEVGIHFGVGSAATRAGDRIRDLINHANLGAAGLRRVHLVNLLFYEQIKSRHIFRDRFTLMPHPVPANPRLSKADSRRILGIPEDGRYIGLVASIDSRKAVDEFLAAFRAASTKPNERLLLAGWINGTHLKTIEDKYGDLLKQRRVVLLNGFLDPSSYQSALSALDVVCTPYPRFAGLSSTLLEGVAAGRPILANSFGWSQALVKRFRLGWTCDVLNHESFTRTIRAAFDQSDEYRESGAVTRLLAFHAPENFAETWVHGIRQELGRPASSALSWDWVMESIPASDRHLV